LTTTVYLAAFAKRTTFAAEKSAGKLSRLARGRFSLLWISFWAANHFFMNSPGRLMTLSLAPLSATLYKSEEARPEFLEHLFLP